MLDRNFGGSEGVSPAAADRSRPRQPAACRPYVRAAPRGRPCLIAATPSVVAVYRTSGHYATGTAARATRENPTGGTGVDVFRDVPLIPRATEKFVGRAGASSARRGGVGAGVPPAGRFWTQTLEAHCQFAPGTEPPESAILR